MSNIWSLFQFDQYSKGVIEINDDAIREKNLRTTRDAINLSFLGLLIIFKLKYFECS